MMNAVESTELIFRSKEDKPKYQVRFWSEQDVYIRFQDEVNRNGFRVKDVYEDFMLWFIKKSEMGEIKVDRG